MEESSFDLIITDIVMPEVNGIVMLHAMQIKNIDTKVIVVSGGGVKMDADSALHAAKKFSIHATLNKPFRGNELISLVKGALA